MTVAICDDEKNIRTYLTRLVRQQDMRCEVKEYCSAAACMSEAGAFDVLFLDIELGDRDSWKADDLKWEEAEQTAGSRRPGEEKILASGDRKLEGERSPFSGMAVARRIREMELARQPVIIFVTGYENYVYDAFDVGAFQYLLKPVDEKRFAEVFRRAVEYVTSQAERLDRKLMVQVNGMNRMISCADICYVESRGHKAILCLKGQDLECWMKIGELEETLGPLFFRIHKGYLINLACVDGYSRTEVVMSNGDRLPLSKYKYADFVKAYLRFIR